MFDTGTRLLVFAGLRHFRRHYWQLALVLTGIALGVAVVLAVDLANQSSSASFEESTRQLSGATTHRIRSPLGHFDDSLYTRLKRTPGLPSLAPLLEGRVRVAGQAGTFRLVGIDIFAEGEMARAVTPATEGQGDLTQWLTDPGAVSLAATTAKRLGVRVGDSISVRHRGRSGTLTVFSIVSSAAGSAGDSLFVDMATAQRLLDARGKLTSIDMISLNDPTALFSGLLPGNVELITIDDEIAGVQGLTETFSLNLTAMSLLALLVGAFLVFNAVSLSLLQRRPLLGRLRALGVTPGELASGMLLETLVLAVVGTLLGIALGILIGTGLTRIVAATVNEIYYRVSVDAMTVTPLSLVKAIVLGPLVTLIASIVPIWHAANSPPVSVLSRADLEQAVRVRLAPIFWIGIGTALLGWVVATLLPGGLVMAFFGLFILVMGLALTLPRLLSFSSNIGYRLDQGLLFRIVMRSIDRHLSRLAVAVAALAIALAAGVGVGTMVESMRGGVTHWLKSLLNAPVYVAYRDFQDNASLPTDVIKQITEMEETAELSSYRSRRILVGGISIPLVAANLAPTSRQGFEFLDVDARAAWQGFDAGHVLVTEPLASRMQISAGDMLNLPTISGARAFRVAATFRDYASEHGRVFITLAHYRKHWQDQAINSVAVIPISTVDAKALSNRLAEQLAAYPEVALTRSKEIYEESIRVFDRTFRITEALRLLALTVAFIGVFSALSALQLERRKEFAVLRALGMTRGQLVSSVLLESSWIGLFAGLMSIPLGLAMAWLLVHSVQQRAFGWTMPFSVEPGILVTTVLVGVFAALLAAIYPALRAAHAAPGPMLRED